METNTSTVNLSVLTLNVGLAHHNNDWNWKNVRSPFARLYYVTEGEAQVELPSGIVTLTPGHLYLIPPFTTHSNICTGAFSHYYIHIYEADEKNSLFDTWDFPVKVDAETIDSQLMQRLCDINPFLKLPQSNPDVYDNHLMLMNNLRLNQNRPYSDKVESRGILFVLLSRFLAKATPKAEVGDSRIQKTIRHIRNHISKPLSLDELSSMACMSKDHYIRMFKQSTGQTPVLYIVSRRMEKAELLLVTTTMPVKQLAREVGYEDTSYFNRLFRKHVGLSPQMYRQGSGLSISSNQKTI